MIAACWNYDSPAGTEIHTTWPVDKDRVLIMQNGNPAKALIINKVSNRVEKELVLPTRVATGWHSTAETTNPAWVQQGRSPQAKRNRGWGVSSSDREGHWWLWGRCDLVRKDQVRNGRRPAMSDSTRQWQRVRPRDGRGTRPGEYAGTGTTHGR